MIPPEPEPVHVLVIEHGSVTCRSLEAILGDLGVILVSASSEDEVFRKVQEHNFAATILGVTGPGASGLGLARAVRSLDRGGRTPILFLSDDSGVEFPLALAYSLGAVDHVASPIIPVVLRAKVSGSVELARAHRRAEQLREWHLTLASIGDGVIATDGHGRITLLNPVAERLTGWSLADARGRSLKDLYRIVNEVTRTEIENPVLRAIQSGSVIGRADQMLLISRDGMERPIDDSASPIRNPDGSIGGAVLVFRDITERKAAALTQARLAAIVESSDEAIVGKDLDGTIRTWNRGAERVFGYTAAEAIGRSITIVVPPDRLVEVRDILERLRRGERVEQFETQRVRKDGTRIDLSLTISPIRDSGGRVIGASKIAHDITTAKRETRTLSSALQAGEIGTYYWDIPTDRVTGDRNFAALYGVLPDESTSAPVADFLAVVHPDDRDRVRSEIRRTLDGGDPFRSEYRILSPSGERWLLARGAVEHRDGVAVGWAGVVVDITDRKRAEIALAASRARLDYAVRASQIGFWYCDLPFDVLEWDDRVKDHFWLPPDARVTIDMFYDRIHAEDREPTRAAIERSVTGRTGYDVHYRTVDPGTKAEKWVRAIGGADYDAAGTPIRFDGVTLDVTDARRADAAVRESNDRFRVVARATNDVVWDWDMRTNAVWWNEGVTTLFGYARESVGPDATWWYGHIHPDDRERVVVGIHATIDGGQAKWSDEYRFRRADGTFATVLDRGFAVREGEHTIRLVGAMQDVSERRQSEERLRVSEQRFRSLFESMDEGYCVVEPVFDENGRATDYRYLLANPALERQTGMRGVIGRTAREMMPKHEQFWIDAYANVARSGETVRRTDFVADLGRWFDVSAFPVGSPEQRRVGVLFNDISARKRAEAAVQFLADASASLAELVDYQSTLNRIANLAVAEFADWCVVDLLDESGNWNRLAVTVAESAAVTSARAADAAYDTADGMGGVVPHVPATGEPDLVEDLTTVEPTTAPQGGDRLARLRNLGVRSYLGVPFVSRGRVIGGITFLCSSAHRRFGIAELRVARNLAERVTVAIENAQLYRTLQEQDRRKDEFLAILAHELRNPLAPVRNGVQILKGGATGDIAGRVVAMMDRQLGHITHLVEDLMDVARVSSGKVVLRKERIPLRAIVDAAVEASRQGIDSAGHELTLRMPTEPLAVEADQTRLVQILANLLSNAGKYTPPGGKIALSAQREGDSAVIRVTDTGLGIPAEMLPRIFDMFAQVGSTLERSQGGLGIGLTLVKRLIEMHGGSVTAESPGPGSGSTFTVRMPLSVVPISVPGQATVPESSPGRSLDILVVDDNRDAADSLALLLEILGHRVRVARDGAESLQVLESYRPQLILLDLGLPGMSGYEVAGAIRSRSELKGATLAALTGWGQEEDRRRTREAGFDHHLTKPAGPDDLDRILADVLYKS